MRRLDIFVAFVLIIWVAFIFMVVPDHSKSGLHVKHMVNSMSNITVQDARKQLEYVSETAAQTARQIHQKLQNFTFDEFQDEIGEHLEHIAHVGETVQDTLRNVSLADIHEQIRETGEYVSKAGDRLSKVDFEKIRGGLSERISKNAGYLSDAVDHTWKSISGRNESSQSESGGVKFNQ